MERKFLSLEGKLKQVQWEVGLLCVREKETWVNSRLDDEGNHVEVLNLGNKEQLILGQNAHCDRSTSEYIPLHDVTNIVEFCVHAMGILESKLTREKLAKVGCRPSETEEFLFLLVSKHL